jgi:hypothetical protein
MYKHFAGIPNSLTLLLKVEKKEFKECEDGRNLTD